MRRRIVVLFLAAVMAMSVGVTARADVLWEPENRFYEKHSQECEHLGRGFYANGPEGFVTLWDAPNGSQVQGQLTNGGELWVDCATRTGPMPACMTAERRRRAGSSWRSCS